MSKIKDINDDQIMVLGSTHPDKKSMTPQGNGPKRPVIFILIVAVAIIGFVLWKVLTPKSEPQPVKAETIFEQVNTPKEDNESPKDSTMQIIDQTESKKAYVEIRDTVVNDIKLRITIPYNAFLKLHVGEVDFEDTTMVYCAQAADIRRDNGKIVGGYVLNGEPLAWGRAKSGFCAIINDSITIGVAKNTPLFEEATEQGGSFFRQFPLVDNGQLVENELRGKSKRRSLCEYKGKIIVVETMTLESFHDFSQVLVDLGMTNAIYLVCGTGTSSYSVLESGKRVTMGTFKPNPPKYINYIIWYRK